MKKMIIYNLLFTIAAVLTGCGGGDNDEPTPPAITITAAPEQIDAPAAGGSYTVNVTTTGKEWGAYADGEFIKVFTEGSLSQKGSIKVTVAENPYTEERSGSVTVMSGAARKTISVHQAAAEKPGYDAPDGYQLVWNDEFESGSELNSNDWTHEVKKDHWVNNELQNYVNHKSPDGKLVTEVKNGTLRINCFKENGKVYSGRVYAKVREGWQHGYFEARIKLPKGKGTWPAFWMMPVNNDWGTNPWPMAPSADEMTTYVDGTVQLNVKKSVLGSGHNQWPFHYPFYLILNLAWGGDWGGMNGVDESALPITMEVDYVRVFQKK